MKSNIEILNRWSPIFDSLDFDKSRYLTLSQYCENFCSKNISNTQTILPFCLQVLGNIIGESSQIIFNDDTSLVLRDIKLDQLLDEKPSFEIITKKISIREKISDIYKIDIVSHLESSLSHLVINEINEVIRVEKRFVFSHDFLENLNIEEDQLGFKMKVDLKYIRII